MAEVSVRNGTAGNSPGQDLVGRRSARLLGYDRQVCKWIGIVVPATQLYIAILQIMASTTATLMATMLQRWQAGRLKKLRQDDQSMFAADLFSFSVLSLSLLVLPLPKFFLTQ